MPAGGGTSAVRTTSYNARMLTFPVPIRPPIIQIAIDVPDIDDALRLAGIGVEAGVDWLEAGTPLIVRRGADAIGAIARAFPAMCVLADYKTMDSGGKNVHLTKEQGGHVMTVCAGAPDDTIKAAMAADSVCLHFGSPSYVFRSRVPNHSRPPAARRHGREAEAEQRER